MGKYANDDDRVAALNLVQHSWNNQEGFLAVVISDLSDAPSQIAENYYYTDYYYYFIIIILGLFNFYAPQHKASRRENWSKVVATALHSVLMVFWKDIDLPQHEIADTRQRSTFTWSSSVR